MTDGEVMKIDNPAELPDPASIEEIREPIILASILMPPDYVGNVMQLCEEKRGVQKNLRYLGNAGADRLRDAAGRSRARLLRPAEERVARLRLARLPLPALPGRRPGRLDVLVNGDKVDALAIDRPPRQRRPRAAAICARR